MSIEARKNEDFKFRLDSITLDLLERAKEYVGLDKSKFIRESIREKAQSVIAEHEKTIFTQKDWKMFFAMLDKPLHSSSRMKKAARKYKSLIKHAV
jgi:uncharacterized protein (DUF1778 family)